MQIRLMTILLAAALFWGLGAAPASAASGAAFRFEKYPSLAQMREYILRAFPLGSSRKDLQDAFAGQGRAKQVAHPENKNVEKFIYDINMCDIYVWRWNISADYDDGGRLLQAYVNGRPVFMSGAPQDPLRTEAMDNVRRTDAMKRKRPEARKGLREIPYIRFDSDGSDETSLDRTASGTGPERADPFNLGTTTLYDKVVLWRSIFEEDEAPMVAYPTCRMQIPSNPLLELILPELTSPPPP